MIKLKIISIVTLLGCGGVTADELITDAMAAYSIPYALRICELEKESSNRKGISKKLAKTLFIYWYETEFLETQRIDSVSRMARYAYIVSCEKSDVFKFFKEGLKVPLNALGEDEILRVRKHWKFSTKSEYQQLLKKYNVFVEKESSDGVYEN